MMKDKEALKIVFMGTPEFAVTILDKIVEENYQVVSVVTAPDRPAGRGRRLNESAVKKAATAYNLPVLQPEKLRDEEFLAELKALEADLFIVVAFRMLPKDVWSIPSMGTFNLHGSLLPQYRGAAPINWAIINGEKETGVTTFFIDEKIDTGNILLKDTLSIGGNETAGELHDRMMHVGAQTVADTIELIRTGKAKAEPQDDSLALKEAPKINKQDCLIDFNLEIQELHNLIRGMSPYPTAWLTLKHIESGDIKTLKVFRTHIADRTGSSSLALVTEDRQLFLQTTKGKLEILELQLEGKRRLETKDFILGFNSDEWEISLQKD